MTGRWVYLSVQPRSVLLSVQVRGFDASTVAEDESDKSVFLAGALGWVVQLSALKRAALGQRGEEKAFRERLCVY